MAEIQLFQVQQVVHQAKANTKIIPWFYNWDFGVAGCHVMASSELFHQSSEYTHDASHGATNVHFPQHFSHHFLLFWGHVNLYGVGSLTFISMAVIEKGH